METLVHAEAVVRRLADGRLHSGADLAREFGVSRAAIWKQIRKLEDWGLEVQAAAGRGYRLAAPIDFLDRARITAAVERSTDVDVAPIEVFTVRSSTNQYLRERAPPEVGSLAACLAEYQSAGRGRRGRRWNAPLGGGLCLSVAWQFADVPRDISALTLAIGVAARQAIRRIAGVDADLKWPNDLMFAGRKLGGILVEVSLESQGSCHIVAGLGINVSIATNTLAALGNWPSGAIDLDRATNGTPPSRSELAGAIICNLAELLKDFATTGFRPYYEEWLEADFLRGRLVEVEDGSGLAVGTMRGIAADGALLLDLPDGARRRVFSGDVSVRPTA